MKVPVTVVVVAGTTVLADGWGKVGIAALVGTKASHAQSSGFAMLLL